MSKSSISLIFLMFLCACASTVEHNDAMQEITIHNDGGSAIHNVHLAVSRSGGVESCTVIPEKSDCTLSFPAYENRGQETLLSWIQLGQTYRKDLSDQVNSYKDHPNPLSIIVAVKEGGLTKVSVQKNKKKLYFR